MSRWIFLSSDTVQGINKQVDHNSLLHDNIISTHLIETNDDPSYSIFYLLDAHGNVSRVIKMTRTIGTDGIAEGKIRAINPFNESSGSTFPELLSVIIEDTPMLSSFLVFAGGCLDSIDILTCSCAAMELRIFMELKFEITRINVSENIFHLTADLRKYRKLQWQVDAFSNGPFTGNPAGVVCSQFTIEFMQAVAMENNLAETSFIKLIPGTISEYSLRWFTPANEIELCGHATLAAAHVLFDTGRVPRSETIRFHTVYSGILTAAAVGENDSIELDFPSTPPKEVILSPEEYSWLEAGLGLRAEDILFIGKSRFDVFVQLTIESFMRIDFNVNYSAIANFSNRGVIITCAGAKHWSSETREVHRDSTFPSRLNEEVDFMSRFFAPRCGVNEDPVTGSAHCALAPFWFSKLAPAATNESTLMGFQASQRGGLVQVRLVRAVSSSDEPAIDIGSTTEADRVKLGGNCCTIISSQLVV